jgi:hypothetical protein
MKQFITWALLLLGYGSLTAGPTNGGYAFTSPVHSKQAQVVDQRPQHLPHSIMLHITWFHLQTRDSAVVKKAEKIFHHFMANHSLTTQKQGHCVVSWNGQRAMWGNNSMAMEGDIETFKKELHHVLAQNPLVAKALSPYRPAHVDLYGNDKDAIPFFKKIRISEYQKIKTR